MSVIQDRIRVPAAQEHWLESCLGGAMGQWIFYVDESGSFGAPDGSSPISFVGGVLLDVSEREANIAVLKGGLQGCFPLLPWPLHSTVARRPAAHLAGAMLLGQALKEPPSWVEPLRTVVVHGLEPALVAFRRSLADREMPAWQTLRDTEMILRSARRSAMDKLTEYVEHGDRLLASRLAHVNELLHGALFGVGAAVGPGVTYSDAVVACVRAALRVLRAEAGAQPELRLTVASRGLDDGSLLTQAHLKEFIEDALKDGVPFANAPRPDVAVEPDQPKVMGEDTTPWLVVADFICNRLFYTLGSASQWADVEAASRRYVGLPVRGTPPWFATPLPALDYAPGPTSHQIPGWAREQRAVWALARRPS